jgi:hypothetical protein
MRATLTAFALSGFLAAVAGVLFVHHQHALSNSITGNPFSPRRPAGVHDRRHRGPRVDPRLAPRGPLRVHDAVLHAPRVPLPRHRLRPPGPALWCCPAASGPASPTPRRGLRWVASAGLLVPSLVATAPPTRSRCPPEAVPRRATSSSGPSRRLAEVSP